MSKYYYLLLPQVFVAKDEVFEELLRERVTYYLQKNRPLDFWLVPAPAFFSTPTSPLFLTCLSNYFGLFSPNKECIQWVKLRIGFVQDANTFKKGVADSSELVKIYGEIPKNFDLIDDNSSVFDSVFPKYSKELLESYHQSLLGNLFSTKSRDILKS